MSRLSFCRNPSPRLMSGLICPGSQAASPPHILTTTFCPSTPAFLANKHEPDMEPGPGRHSEQQQHCHPISHLPGTLDTDASPPNLVLEVSRNSVKLDNILFLSKVVLFESAD